MSDGTSTAIDWPFLFLTILACTGAGGLALEALGLDISLIWVVLGTVVASLVYARRAACS